MLQESVDFAAEADELYAFLKTLDPKDWDRATGFMGWTPWDVVAHLHFFDRVSLVAMQGEEAFAAERERLVTSMGKGETNQQAGRRTFEGIAADALLEQWHTSCRDLAEQLGALDAKARLPWFGPDMGVRMFTTARLMETWAHGQEIYDLVGASREPTDRIAHIAAIGAKTFGWTFVNRQMEIPGPAPYVRLTAPSGAIWEYNDPSETESVRGSALDFCHVVTQARNVADTQLEVKGPVAEQWMAIAQCFAGGAADPPKPGERG